MSNVSVIEQREARPNLVAGGRMAPIIPQTMDEAYRMAKAVCMAGMAPKGMDTPEKAMIAIMRGLEVGLSPFQALDKIAVVNGRPTIWGDGAMGLVRGSGLCEWVSETHEGSGDSRIAVCEVKRRGDPKPIRRTFSVADAKKAGLWNKQGPWSQYADRMLQMRARAFALRDGFADVLGGLYLREEIETDEGPSSNRNAPARAPESAPQTSATRRAPPPPAIRHDEPKQLPAAPPTPEKDGGAVPPVVSPSNRLAGYADALKAAQTMKDREAALDAIDTAWAEHVEPMISDNSLTQTEYEEASALDNATREAIAP